MSDPPAAVIMNQTHNDTERIGGDGEEVNGHDNILLRAPIIPQPVVNQTSNNFEYDTFGQQLDHREDNEDADYNNTNRSIEGEEQQESDPLGAVGNVQPTRTSTPTEESADERRRYDSRDRRDRDRYRDRDHHKNDRVRDKDKSAKERERYTSENRDRDAEWDNRSQGSFRHRYSSRRVYPSNDADHSSSSHRHRPPSRNYHEYDAPSDRDYYRSSHHQPYNESDYYSRRRHPEQYYNNREYPPRDVRNFPEYPTTMPYNYSLMRSGYAVPAVSERDLKNAYLAELRVKEPSVYRQWYNQFQAYKQNPERNPCPPIPGFVPLPQPAPVVGITAANMNLSYGAVGPHSLSVYAPSERDSITGEDNRFIPLDNLQHKMVNGEEEAIMRRTPQKFHVGHCIGLFTPFGQMLKIRSDSTSIKVMSIKSLVMHLPEYKAIQDFPGPLIKNSTHKSTVIQFCERKIKEAQANDELLDRDNFILLWEFLILLLRQNGAIIGSDIAELLLKNKTLTDQDPKRDSSSGEGDDGVVEELIVKSTAYVTGSQCHVKSVDEPKITQKFCDLLLYGHKKEALECAMNNGLWGHALFLASKMDERSYGNVLARFANGLAHNHPLQTLYQLMSGRQPASVKGCADDTFGDWKPHLAMILSNSGERPELECKSIISLGDTLGTKERIFAACSSV